MVYSEIMLAWLEKRTHLKYWLTRPALPRGAVLWLYFPGFFAIVLLVWQIWSGIGIAPYTFENFQTGHSQTIYNKPFLHNGHRWGAHFLLLCVFLHFLRVLLQGSYRKPKELPWFSGMILAVTLLVLFWTGTMLPLWDEHSQNTQLNFYWIYALHISVLPLGYVLQIFLHLWLRQRVSEEDRDFFK